MSYFDRKIAIWKKGARLIELSDEFEKLASGATGKPSINEMIPDFQLFNGNLDIFQFYETYKYYSGKFNLHFLTSVPYILEEECRLGTALLQYLLAESNAKKRITTLQTIGNAEGVIARAIADLGNGKISTLTNSPTASNMREFFNKRVNNSFFHLGPFFEVTKTMLGRNKTLHQFSSGFDVIYEDTTFQMYGKDRKDQIEFALQNIRKDGLFICLEKCMHIDQEEYYRRESQKNRQFKNKFYSKLQLKEKEKILNEMKTGQVSLTKLNKAIKKNLRYSKLIWNSGNFYIIAASNNMAKLESFVSILGPMCIRPEFIYETIPSTL